MDLSQDRQLLEIWHRCWILNNDKSVSTVTALSQYSLNVNMWNIMPPLYVGGGGHATFFEIIHLYSVTASRLCVCEIDIKVITHTYLYKYFMNYL
jgi:hypothetical protein